jgi:hypothetical protein
MPFWLVYMEIYGIDLLTFSFVIYISKHHHHHYQGVHININSLGELEKIKNILKSLHEKGVCYLQLSI